MRTVFRLEAVQKLYEIRERGGMMRPGSSDRAGMRQPDVSSEGHRNDGANDDETVTLTRAELVELLAQSSRL